MRKSRIVIIISFLLILALLATGLFACKKKKTEDPSEGRVVAVSTAMDTIYAAMTDSDGSKTTNFFTLRTTGSYTSGETVYDVKLAGTFDISQNNRDDDKRSQFLLEVKKGGIEVLLFYYSEGKAYLDFPPYVRRGVISDFNLAEVVHRIVQEKENGVVKTVADSLPLIASRIFTECRCFSEDTADRYVFTLSYARLFDAVGSIVDSWHAGFTPMEFLSALHIDEDDTDALVRDKAVTTVQFVVKDGAFLSAKAETAEKGAISLDTFSLTRGSDEIELPSALGTFTEFDFSNFSLNGKMYLHVQGDGDRETDYDVSVTRDYGDVTYPFDYDFKSHYVAGQGWEFSLSLTDKNGKHSSFDVRGDYLYLDLTAYGVGKCKIATDELSDRLGTTGFKDVEDYTFRDRLHLLVLLAAGRSEANDVVTYTLGAEFFEGLSRKIGFKGLFGINEAVVSWSKANDRLQDLSASITVGGMTASMSSAAFTFGTPVTLSAITDADYVDLTAKETTHLSFSGTFRQNTSMDSESAVLSSLLSSLSGVDLSFASSGAIQYTADLVYGKTGAMKGAFVRLFDPRGNEIVNLYYTDETPDDFYLIYPEDRGSGVRSIRSFAIAESPLAAFNEALGAGDSALGRRIFLATTDSVFMFGLQSPMVDVIAEKIALIYPDFAMKYLSQVKCRRYEVRISESTITTRVVFDNDNDVQFTATSFKVTFDEDITITSATAVTPTTVALLADNAMPEEASVVFPGGLTYKVSLLDALTGEKVWTYKNTPRNVGSVGQRVEVEATASVLGKKIVAIVNADCTPPTAVEIANSAKYSDRYDATTRTFRMDYYNDASPREIFDTFSRLTATVNGIEYAKTIEWDLKNVHTGFGVSDVRVEPKVRTYFGDMITLGNNFRCTLHVDGTCADSTEYTMTFVAYDGRDPLDPAVYSDVLVVKTVSGETIEVRHVEWDLTNPMISEKIRENPSENKKNTLYAYSTGDTPEIMHAHVYDSAGNYVPLDVKVYFESRIVGTVDFDLSDLQGVRYDAEKGFTFDVLLVRGLNPTKTDGVLPQSFVANAEKADEFRVTGINWSFTAVTDVLNASGKKGQLTLKIGDNISGYQEKVFDYTFTALNITNVELLTKEKAPTQSINRVNGSLYAYSATNLNAYTYTFPAYARVTYSTTTGEAHEDLLINWSYDPAFDEDLLCNGGSYRLTGAIGSETLTVNLSFDREIITSYRFGDESAVEDLLSSGVLSTHEGKICLTFSALSALAENGTKYNDKTKYPSTLEVAFNGDTNYIPIAVSWDLSAYDNRENMLGNGFFSTVTATAKGQKIDVYVYIAAAFDVVYTNESLTEVGLTFSLMSAGELLSDGKHHALVVTDPREESNDPSKLYIAADQTVRVEKWLGLEAVTRLYSENYDTLAPNAITGNVTVRAKIGNDSVGYKEIDIPVSIVDSVIDNSQIKVSGLPFAASSEMTGGATVYAITPQTVDMTVDGVKCGLALELNPYYVDPKAQRTYPTYLDFELDGISVRSEATWDLDKIPANAAAIGETVDYLVWAMVDLGSSFKNVKVPVVSTVLKREIDVVWISEDSTEKYIDIDGYSFEPFGGEIVGDWVYLDVKVQFKKDANRYPLKLKYNKKDVLLCYDGSNIYPDVPVYVGNESGGYRTIEGYTIRILSNIISKVVTSGDKIFYQANYDPETGKITYETPASDSVDIVHLPDTIDVYFNYGSEKVVVPLATENNAGKGLVFSWDRSKDEHHYLGIYLWNPSVSETVGAGMIQTVYNREQSNYATPTADMFFDGSFTDTVTYRDIADEAGPITVGGFIADRASEILDTEIGKEYQILYITDESDKRINSGTLGAGNYRLYVSVEGHEQYNGEVYHTFTIEKKEVTAEVVLYVNGARRDSEVDPREVYTGNEFRVGAKTPDYPVDVPLLVDGESVQIVTDVRYDGSGKAVIAYTFTVAVNEEDEAGIGKNYYVTDASVSFKIVEASLPAGAVSYHVGWTYSQSAVNILLTVFGEILNYDENLTNGYKIFYYETSSSEETIPEGDLTSGHTYYYTIQYKIPNYESGYIGIYPRERLDT